LDGACDWSESNNGAKEFFKVNKRYKKSGKAYISRASEKFSRAASKFSRGSPRKLSYRLTFKTLKNISTDCPRLLSAEEYSIKNNLSV
jgi:hypothetical protein